MAGFLANRIHVPETLLIEVQVLGIRLRRSCDCAQALIMKRVGCIVFRHKVTPGEWCNKDLDIVNLRLRSYCLGRNSQGGHPAVALHSLDSQDWFGNHRG